MRPRPRALRANPGSIQARGLTGWWSALGDEQNLLRNLALAGRREAFVLQTSVGSPAIAEAQMSAALSIGSAPGARAQYQVASAISSYITASSAALSCWVRVLADGVSGANVYLLGHVLGDGTNNYIGIYQGNLSGGGQKLHIYNWDGNEDSVSVAYVQGQWHHIMLWHHGGTLALYFDGRLVNSVASGDTQVTSNVLSVGTNGSWPEVLVADIRCYSGAWLANPAPLAWSLWHPSTRWELYGVPELLRPPMVHVEGGPTALTWLPQGHTRGERPPILIEG